jgi:CP family cyanate transporter-like MFS transporter
VTLGGLLVVALSLRPQIIAIGPLLPEIRAELGVAFAVAGLLSSIPVLCMGVFAPLGPVVARALGAPLAIAACVVAILAFGLLRAVAPTAEAAIAFTFGIGLGMGVAGPILPMLVRALVPSRPAVATGFYATGIVLGGLLAAAVALPLATVGGWRGSLALISLASLPSLAAWLLLISPRGGPDSGRLAPPRLPWRRPSAWLLGVLFGLQSTVFYGVQTWLANVYLERGADVGEAAALVVLLNAVSVATTLVAPVLSDRLGSRHAQLPAAALVSVVGCFGIAAGLGASWFWVTLVAIGTGATFPIVLTLPVDAADHPADVGAIAAFMLLIGYVVASAAPVALGFGRDVTGDFGASMWLLAAVAASLVVVARLGVPRARRATAG